MREIADLLFLVARQAADGSAADGTAPNNSDTTSDDTTAPSCDTGNEYDGRMGLRIAAVFIILVTSFLGTWFPIFSWRHRSTGVPEWAFFIAKYFGSGVIITTAFIHLLSPAYEALTNECLTGPITDYDWVAGIVLMTIFVLFFVELMTMRYAKFGHSHGYETPPPGSSGHAHAHAHPQGGDLESGPYKDETELELAGRRTQSNANCPTAPHVPGGDHLGHAREHVANEDVSENWAEASPQGDKNAIQPESYAAQMTAIAILEFGVIFHSVFIGLTLAVAGSEFVTLFIVIIFHQCFEGLGLGSRLASVPWPKSKRFTPYILGTGYSLATPIALAIGLGVRNSYPPESATTLIVNGVFDSISAGILIYTGLVELMAHEFMFSPYMQRASIKTVLGAFFTMCVGAALMALLGKWA